MKLKLNRKKGYWNASVHYGNGGVNSMINGRGSRNILYVLKVFSIKNIIRALKGRK